MTLLINSRRNGEVMRRIDFGSALLCVVITGFGLIACNSATPPEPNEPVIAEVEETPDSDPTVTIPTATPTEARAVAPAEAPPLVTPTATQTRPSASPTPEVTPTPLLYIVEEYDTLLGIAIDFDTTVEALTVANGINENDFLQIGQELIIPTAVEATAIADNTEQVELSADAATPQTDSVSGAIAANTTNTEPTTGDTAEVVVAGGGASVAPAVPQEAPSSSDSTVNQPPTLDLTRPANINPLTGLPVDDPSTLQRRPLMVRIGNDVVARTSQAGLNSADMVYEEIAEWWVTRFTAIFLAETPRTVAPIRSARLINVQLVPQYQGALAHSGGSDPVRWEISQAPIVNLDEFYNALPYYYRPNEGWQTRLALDTVAARDYMVAKGVEAPVSLNGFLFSGTITKGEPGENIYIPYPRATTFTQWRHDPATGKYSRWAAGEPLWDANGLGQVAASNVIIYFAEHQETDIVEDSNGATSIRILVNGRGPAWFFRDGKLNKGFWQTDGTRTPYFGYEDGSPYSLKPGNTWVEVVPTYFTIGLNSPDEASAKP